MSFNLKNVMLSENVDVKVIEKIIKLSQAYGYSNTLFVAASGDNTDGLSWETAYTSLSTALDDVEDNEVSGQNYLILLGVGTFDMNTTGTPTYTTDFDIVGSGQSQSIIKNTHASATAILKFTGLVKLFSLKIDTGASAIDGVIVSGRGADGFECGNVYFEGDSATGAMDLLYFDGGIEYVKVKDCKFHGVVANTTGIHLNEAEECWFQDVWVEDCLIAVHLDNAGDDANHFLAIHIDGSTTGIQVDVAGATNNHFEDIQFQNCTTNFDDNGTTSLLARLVILPKPAATVTPSNLTGVAVTAGVGANTYGAAIEEIRTAVAATKPYYVTGMLLEPDTAEKWGIALYDDGGTAPFWEGVIEQARGVADVAQREMFPQKYLCNQGTQLSAKVKSETGGNDLDIWLFLEII